MSALEDIQAKVPRAFDEITRQTHVRPTSVGVTKKGQALAFFVSLPVVPDLPGPSVLFGIPVVYGMPTTPPVFLSRRRARR